VAKYLNTMLLQAGCFNCFCIISNNRGILSGRDFVKGGDFVLDSMQTCPTIFYIINIVIDSIWLA